VLLALAASYFFQFFLVYFVGDKFLGAKDFIFWISLSFAFSGMYKMVVNYIFYVGKTKILAWLTFSSAILNIFLNYIFISYYGAIGAAISTLVINIIFFLLTWVLSNRLYKMPWFLNK
jgi:O-antigen/teichoic acid export membrane protein